MRERASKYEDDDLECNYLSSENDAAIKDTVRVKTEYFSKKKFFQLAYDFFYALFISEKNIVKNES